ncbi:ser/Thr protein phosphatase family protein [Hypoxylon trugodes]|uniref:ser/Thr protein phosphatase family protein n=1 Tax=Hypoxylon trugodes TaxID=326681 RepID=UPI002191C154|nr:ser/Thr protein phosphatase family protein [Hypoxylon trugodes]KAI1387949.1 ser/Thr protein phosphatase family protein [Hypoxylon trugodes]
MTAKTRFFIISDTHAGDFNIKPGHGADVVIHCGDLTEESKIHEYHHTLQLLKDLDAPLKLVIAGNHDFTLDTPAFRRKVDEATEPLDPELVRKEYGDYGEARQLFDSASGITFLDEGTHQFNLHNGATMTIYASPYTPSKGGNAYQYDPELGHQFDIGKDVDIVITHGPPHGIMDFAESRRAGCPHLFGAVARARPRIHCFGHTHEGWGAKIVAWREHVTKSPSHFTDIDNGRSTVIEKLSNITKTKFDTPESVTEKFRKAEQYTQRGYCATCHCDSDSDTLKKGTHTLFINAAVEGLSDELPIQPPWLVDIDLPLAHQHNETKTQES